MRKIFVFLALILIFTLVSCTQQGNVNVTPDDLQNEETIEGETINEPKVADVTRVVALKGPTGIGMAKMISDADSKYSFELSSAPTDVTAAVISKSVDIAAVPTNLASTLYNKTEGEVQVIALNTLGVLHIVNSDGTVATLEDLRGKTIGATGQASTPEYVLNYILEKNNIIPGEDVKIEWYTDHAELATKMITGDVKIGMLPEPNVSTVLTKNADCKAVIDMTAEWDKIAPDSALVQGCVVVRREFAEVYPDSVKAFLKEYSDSVEFANIDVNAAQIVVDTGIVGNAEIAKRAIPNCNIVYVDSNNGMKNKLSGFLQVLFDADPKSVGGKLPLENFYYENK